MIHRTGPCPACENYEARLLYEFSEGSYVRCSECGLVSVDPPQSESAWKTWVDYWAKEQHQAAIKMEQHYSPQFQSVAFGGYLKQMAGFRQTGRLVDVGCGIGGFVHAAQQAGWDATGVEVSSSAQVGQEHGLKIVQSTLQEAAFPDNYFDVVTMFDVIEHISKPISILQECLRILRPQGMLLVITPNLSGLTSRLLGQRWEAVEPLNHVMLFDLPILSKLLKRNGYEIHDVQVVDLNLAEWANIFRPNDTAQLNLEERKMVQLGRRKLIGKVSGSPTLRGIRRGINMLLNLTRAGDKLIVTAVKPD